MFVAAVIKSSELRAQKARPAAAGATKKRQGDYDSSLIQSNSNRVDPDNPLEMFFYSEMKREDDDLMDETNKEHENSFEIVDMERIYDTLFEILWYIGLVSSLAKYKNSLVKGDSFYTNFTIVHIHIT